MAYGRRRWRRRQGGIDPSRLVFLDESAIKTNMTRLRGRHRRRCVVHGMPNTIYVLTNEAMPGLVKSSLTGDCVAHRGPQPVIHCHNCWLPAAPRKKMRPT